MFEILLSILLGYLPRSGIIGSYVNSRFNFLRIGLSDFPGGHTILHSHQQHMRSPGFP